MKKTILTLMAAMVMMLSLGVTASAADKPAPTVAQDVSINVTYGSTGTAPGETFYLVWKNQADSTFTIDGTNYINDTDHQNCVPTLGTSTVDNVENVVAYVSLDGTDSTTGQFTFTLPNFSNVGVYTYQLTEYKGNTAGVTYMTDTLYMKVYVRRNTSGSADKLEISGVFFYKTNIAGSENKVGTITNSYGSGSLAVTKEVTGDTGNGIEEFGVTVTFNSSKTVKSTISYTDNGNDITINPSDWTTAGTATTTSITLKNGETVTFTNIPNGVTYTVEEENAPLEGYYDPVYTYSNTADTKVINTSETDTVTITNEKKITVDTGISLDSLPYVLMLLVSVIGLGVLFSGKRLRG
ncbi:MAG: DUF5979 domain-containing protein [Lachnospiraceae bacterium]|nr:DUF5979 domain-containing protein [Lachnospiraceae bacterium]